MKSVAEQVNGWELHVFKVTGRLVFRFSSTLHNYASCTHCHRYPLTVYTAYTGEHYLEHRYKSLFKLKKIVELGGRGRRSGDEIYITMQLTKLKAIRQCFI